MNNYSQKGFSVLILILALFGLVTLVGVGLNFLTYYLERNKPPDFNFYAKTEITFYKLESPVRYPSKIKAIFSDKDRDFSGLVLAKNGEVFIALNDSLNNKSEIMKYSLGSSIKNSVYTLNKKGIVISADPEVKYLYISEPLGNSELAEYGPFKLIEFEISSGAKREVISSLKPVLYGNFKYLFKSSGGDVIGSFGGDGCGGYGEIYIVSSNPRLITETGSGCDDSPRLLGSTREKDSIVMASIKLDSAFVSYFQQIYLQNVVSGEKIVIADFASTPKKYKSAYINDASDKLYVLADKEVLVLNLKTGGSSAIKLDVNLTDRSDIYPYTLGNTPESEYRSREVIFVGSFNQTNPDKPIWIFPNGSHILGGWGEIPSSSLIYWAGFWNDQAIIYTLRDI